MANDTEFTPSALVKAVMKSAIENKGLVSFNDGPVSADETNACRHFIIKRELISKLENGELFSTDFHHVACDSWLWAQAKKMGEAMRCEDAKIEHYHFSNGRAKEDAVYLKGWSKVEEDRAVYAKKLAKLYA